MTKDEFKVLAKEMRSVYAYENFIPDNESFNVWYEALKDLQYHVASAGVKAHLRVSSKTPTPADIRNACIPFMPKRQETNEVVCPACNGLGWKMIKRSASQFYGPEHDYFLDYAEPCQRCKAELWAYVMGRGTKSE